MTKQSVFLIRADDDRECVMRLPVNRNGSITQKGFEAIRRRFYDGSADKHHSMKYAVNLEAFSNGHDIAETIGKYYQNTI